MERAQLRQVRDQIGWSQARMASELGIDKNRLMELEREKGFCPEEGRRISPSYYLINPWIPFAYSWLLLFGGAKLPECWDNMEGLENLKRINELTWDEVSALIGVHVSAIHKWRTKEHAPGIWLGYTLAWLIHFGSRDPFALPYKYEGVDYGVIQIAPSSLYLE
jgi:DNA-binding XRE family transcriptional regulator